jgi:monomeric sarcosine oxidase
MTYQPQIIVIGAGIAGLSTAYALLEQGMRKVRVLEQEVVGHVKSTSSSISRLLRFEYGSDAFYSYMVKISLELWKEFEKKTQQTLYTPTGVLKLGNEGDSTRCEQEIIHGLGISSKYLSAQSCQQRFPQFNTENYDLLTYNSEGGILHAATCLLTLKQMILELGGEICEYSRVTHITHENTLHPIRLELSSGEEVLADRVVIALGPWVHLLLKDMNIPIILTRQYLLYFSGLEPDSFGVGTFPAFIDRNLYGFPIHSGSQGWLKAASHEFGRSIDPDEELRIEAPVISQTVRELRTLLPALRKAKLARIEACIYDISPDEDFILDYVPGDPRLIFVTGLSGHGFKFGLLLGRLMSSLICETPPMIPIGRFQLERFAHAQLGWPEQSATCHC